MQHKPNRLAGETSPYLLQHAYNPVDWYPWGDEALQRAIKENKPILVSIGYSSCHWCHVMERESFEDPATAAIMNEHFINIKIDREERPDLDHIYMDAVQAMTGSGGWPLNVFLTPQLQPFYGGTYFPPTALPQRASWTDVLQGISAAFRERRSEIEKQASALTAHLFQSNNFVPPALTEKLATRENLQEIRDVLMKEADRDWGGFGRAPKFPQTFILRFLMEYHYIYKDAEALNQSLLSLNRMLEGGLYDQVGGGFARYSTDTEWRVPHFEKMLYDNALLLRTLADAFQLTGEERYRRAMAQTIAWVRREMTSKEGGYYSALDADSEGVEGKYYLWSLQELAETLGPDQLSLLQKVYALNEGGNWEGSNILYYAQPLDATLVDTGLSETDLMGKLQVIHEQLLKVRDGRIAPGLDDKIILGSNALYNSALSRAWAATGDPSYREEAVRHMEFMLQVFSDGTSYLHTYKNGESRYAAYLDDLASLIEALLLLQEISGESKWLTKAESITQYVQDNFLEQGTGFFYFTPEGQNDVIIRKKEVYDGAVPSGNALMACNLYKLSFLLHKPEWRAQSAKMLEGLATPLKKYPSSFGLWAGLLLQQTAGIREIAIVGPGAEKLAQELMSNYLPHRVLMYSEKENSEFPLLADKKMADSAFIYNCRDFACEAPVGSVKEFLTSL